MSRAEEITSEVRRLVLTCRAMEAQLQQSIPKKTHQEVVSKMQTTIDGLNSELERVKGEYQKITALNDTIAGIGGQIKSQTESITSLNGIISNQNQVIEAQKSAIEALNSRLSQSTVPILLYNQTHSRIEELQEKIRCMIDKVDYASLQKKCDELTETLKSMVPREDYLALQGQFANFVPRESFEALQKTLSLYVPRDQLVASETRVNELEARIENYVPRSDYEELTARIALLAKEASALSVEVAPVEPPTEQTPEPVVPVAEITPVETQVVPETVDVPVPSVAVETDVPAVIVPEVVEQIIENVTIVEPNPETTSVESPHVDTPSVAEPTPAEITSATGEPMIVTAEPAVQIPTEQTVSSAEIIPETVPLTSEITEIQSQLSEIKSTQDAGATTVEPKTVDSTLGFIFANTAYCAKSGMEFLQDLEQSPIETIQSHMKSGDFERWFKEVLTDDYCAESLKSIREQNIEGEELRTQLVAVIAPRYRK